ncbi:MAG TPA: DnaA/Hda family protein, partial [Bacilli bacterium]|nr:DnaA/Hda family protein [Bacilli bacterium]HQQ38951.1 DnaA/Hda family protein [Bacilli bacterium]
MNNLNVENALDIWQKTIEHLKNQIDDISYNDLFSNTKEVFKVKDSTIWIIVDSIFTKFRIDKFYKNGINEFALNNFGCHFAFIDRKEAEEQRNKVDLVNTTQTDIDNSKKPRSLLPEYSFYNFVIGESNRFAFLAATKVANDPIPVLNPLYIFGGVG